jgi:hypothetical protein
VIYRLDDSGSPCITFLATASARTYDLSPDGRRFLMIKQKGTGGGTRAPEIVVVLNWFEELERLVPVR